MASKSGGRCLAIPLTLLATAILYPSVTLAGATDQRGEQGINAATATAANRPNDNSPTPPVRRHLANSGDVLARDERNQM